jgi:DNA topoisomerase VI subunit B
LKELVDNALDSTEEAGIAPVIEISVSQDDITVADNGPGIAPETVADIIDYTARVSSREAYVSPTRGAQGNALKTVLAMPFALDEERGETILESQGVAHRIEFSIDRIRQVPRISHVCERSPVKVESGSRPVAGRMTRRRDFYNSPTITPGLIRTWALTVEWDRSGETIRRTIAATKPAWKK